MIVTVGFKSLSMAEYYPDTKLLVTHMMIVAIALAMAVIMLCLSVMYVSRVTALWR